MTPKTVRPDIPQEQLATALLRRTTLARSTESFGEAIVRASLLEAVELVRAGSVRDGRVEFEAKVFLRLVPDPNGIDVGFEECMSIGQQTAMQCYIESHAPKP